MKLYGSVKTQSGLSGTVQAVPTLAGFNYQDLSNKPKINGVELTGNVSAEKLGIYGVEKDTVGVSALARDLLITILRNAQYTNDQSENIAALEKALGGEDDGTDSGTIMYSVSRNLTNATASNDVSSVEANSPFECQINADEGYAITSVYATMGGEVLQNLSFTTSQRVENVGVIASAVTGNIVITAVAESAPMNLFDKDTMVITGGYVGTGGAVNVNENAAYARIPIEAGKTYSISMKVPLWSNDNSGNKLIKDADGNTLSVFVCGANTANGEYYHPASVTATNGVSAALDGAGIGVMFTAPDNAAEFWMTTKYADTDCSETLMFEPGGTCHAYVAFVS